jgi:putative peptidoglycan binding protein
VYRALVRVRLPRIFGVVLRNPRDSMFVVLLMLAVIAIVANGLYLQPGRHPAPIFAIRTRPVISDEPVATAVALPQRRPGDADPKPEPAQRNDQAAKNEAVPLPRPRPDPAGDAANPSRQLSAVQRSLNQTGYGPITVTGILDDSTREGIARFERDHNLPITGLNTPRLRHALSVTTGRSLD